MMATYNGEKYIKQQLESVIDQSYTDWRLFVRDDCSQDNTKVVLQKYEKHYPAKIKVIHAAQPSGSAMNNFFALLDYVKSEKSEYVMLADQDDVWKKDKIVLSLQKMEDMEKQFGKNTPLLVHTDLSVVDENLNTINPSIFAMQDMDYRRDQLNNLLASNNVTGCTMLFNRPLLNMLEEKPKMAVMHDIWIALVAAAFGKIGFVPQATILYRQHGSNANGVKDAHSVSYITNSIRYLDKVKSLLYLQFQQAGELLRIYRNDLSDEQIRMLEAYSTFGEKNCLQRAQVLCKYGLNKKGFIRIMGQLFC